MPRAKSSGMILFIILGAAFYNGFLALTQVPQELSQFVVSQGFSSWAVLVIILFMSEGEAIGPSKWMTSGP